MSGLGLCEQCRSNVRMLGSHLCRGCRVHSEHYSWQAGFTEGRFTRGDAE